MNTTQALGRITTGGRHGYLVAIEGCWLTVALDCAAVDAIDPDDAEGYWTNPETGLAYYTIDIQVKS